MTPCPAFSELRHNDNSNGNQLKPKNSAPENPPAFPKGGAYSMQSGMTLRDWFAGHSLAGLLADPELELMPATYAKKAFEVADAMLAERAKGGRA